MSTPLHPRAATILAEITGASIAEGLTLDEQNAVGNWIELVGQVVDTYNAQAQFIAGLQQPDDERLAQQITDLTALLQTLQQSVQSLQQEVNRLSSLIEKQNF